MTAADLLDTLLKANLASGAAILGVVALRKPARSRFGARLAYGLWLLPVLAGAAALLPARQVWVVRAAPVLTTFRIGSDLGVPHVTTAPAGLNGPTLLLGLWLAGVAGAVLFMAVLQHRFIARARRNGVGPAVVGLIAPRILIPRDFDERYSTTEQTLVLAHEQAHLARQDSRLNGMAAAIQCLNWFNPLVHLAAHLMRVDQELACDEAVVDRFPDARRAYAEVLMKAQLAVLPLPLGCYWPSKSQHPLVERVAMLKRPRVGRARWRAGAIVLGCLWAGAGVAAWASQPAEVRTVFKASPVADRPAEALFSDPKVAYAAPDAIVGPQAARSAPASVNDGSPVDPTPRKATSEDDRISSYDLSRRMKQIVMASGMQVTEEQLPALREQALRSLIAERAKDKPTPAQPPILLPWMNRMTIQQVQVVGDQRIDKDAILSMVAIRPGDSVTVDRLNAANKALHDSGLFADWSIQAPPLGGSGDLRVWVKENPPAAQPKPSAHGPYTSVVQRVVIEGNQRIDEATILSKLAIRPGQVLTGPILDAAVKRLFDTGWFADTGPFATNEIHPPPRGGSGDLVVRVNEAPLINQVKIEGNAIFTDVRLRMMMQEQPETPLAGAKMRSDADAIVELYREAGWAATKVTYKVVDLPQKRVDVTLIVDEGAKSPPGDLPTGLITVEADHVDREEGRRRVVFRGSVVTVQRGRRLLSDLLVLSSRAPGESGGPGIKEAMWEGDVRVEIGEQAATADRAVYDGQAKTITLSGNVVVQRGPWVAKNDRLVIEARDP